MKLLNLRFNQITDLPDSIGYLKNLKTLDLTFNKISKLPRSFSLLDNLGGLSLSLNQFRNFPIEVIFLKNLHGLDLSSNQIEKIPEEIQKLENLESLNLSSQQIHEIPDCVGNMTQLKYLYLDYTAITVLPNSFTNLELSEFKFNRYRMEYPPTNIVAEGFDAMRTFWKKNQEDLQIYIQKLHNHQAFTDQELNWLYWKYHPIQYQQVCEMILPRIMDKIRQNLPLNHFEKEFPYYSQYAHLLEPLCFQYVNRTSKFILKLLKTTAQVKCAKKMKILL